MTHGTDVGTPPAAAAASSSCEGCVARVAGRTQLWQPSGTPERRRSFSLTNSPHRATCLQLTRAVAAAVCHTARRAT